MIASEQEFWIMITYSIKRGKLWLPLSPLFRKKYCEAYKKSALKLCKIMNRKNIPIKECDICLNKIMKDCNLFEPIPPEHYRFIAVILSNIIKKK